MNNISTYQLNISCVYSKNIIYPYLASTFAVSYLNIENWWGALASKFHIHWIFSVYIQEILVFNIYFWHLQHLCWILRIHQECNVNILHPLNICSISIFHIIFRNEKLICVGYACDRCVLPGLRSTLKLKCWPMPLKTFIMAPLCGRCVCSLSRQPRRPCIPGTVEWSG